MVKDLRTMNTSCQEEAGVQSCYLPHVTTLTGMGYRRGLIAPSPKAGALGSRAHTPEKTTLTWLSREASTVCPGVKRGKETIGYRKQKWPRWATSAGGRGKWNQGVTHSALEMWESYRVSLYGQATLWREESIPSLSPIFCFWFGLLYSPQINSWVLRFSITHGWSPQLTTAHLFL